MSNLDNEPKRDEMAEEAKPTSRKRSRSKQKRATKFEGVSDKFATSKSEVKPKKTLELKEDYPGLESFAETTGPGLIPPVLKKGKPEFVGDVERVNVRSTWPSRLIVADTPSGEVYDFVEIGTVLPVRAADVQHLLSHNRTDTRGCCGGGHDRIKFELA